MTEMILKLTSTDRILSGLQADVAVPADGGAGLLLAGEDLILVKELGHGQRIDRRDDGWLEVGFVPSLNE